MAGTSSCHVAILLGAKNGEHFLVDQLQSFVNQTHRNWSLIVSDDGSTDRTVDLVREFAGRVSWSVMVRCGPRAGFCRNFLSLVQDDRIAGDYFAFSDQDDIWYADKLERALTLLQSIPQDRPALYCSRTELVTVGARHLGYSPRFAKRPSFQNALVQSIGGGNTMVFNNQARRLLRKVGESDAFLHDWLAYQVISAVGGVVIYDCEPSLKYRQHHDNLVGSNLGFRARVERVRSLFQGKWEHWNELNLTALRRLRADITDHNQKTIDAFIEMRRAAWLPQRLWYFVRSGVYRQTLIGNLGLLVAVIARKI
ncbi:glycosyltransferase family 2 protein [Bradyrhizobium sp. USDA 4504]